MTCQFCASLDRLVQRDQPPSKTEVEIVVRVPTDLPLVNWAVALDRLTEHLGGGEWCYRMAPRQSGRYEVEVRS